MDNIKTSREGHRLSIYFKEKSFPHIQKIVALTEYYRQRGNKQKQSAAYWFEILLRENIDELFSRIQEEEGINLTWEGKSLIIVEKKTASQKMMDKIFKDKEK